VPSGFAEVDGGRLYYEVEGEGPPLVLLHAGIADRRMWDGQFPEFAKSYRTVRYDARNYGLSSDATGDFWNHEDLRAVLDALGVERAALVGVSMGGGAAIDFALTYPGRVTALVAVAPGISGVAYDEDEALVRGREAINAAWEAGDREGGIEALVRLWVDGPLRRPEEVDPRVRAQVAEMLALGWDKGERPEESEIDPPAAARLSEIGVPTQVIYGDHDVRALIGASKLVAENVPGATLAVIAGAAHVPNMEKPDEFNRLVLEFLASVSETRLSIQRLPVERMPLALGTLR
jgi:pimeloyl-ACP methyl ester carboxylesterase